MDNDMTPYWGGEINDEEDERPLGLWIVEEDDGDDEDDAWHPSPNIVDSDPWSMYTYNEESDYY